jgi:excisionase family DNA binding protein
MNDKSTQNKADIWQNELLTVREVATYLRVGRVTVWRWCQQGTIPASRIGRSWRIRRDDLSQFLEAGRFLTSEAVPLLPLVNPNLMDHPQIPLTEPQSDRSTAGGYYNNLDAEIQRDGY